MTTTAHSPPWWKWVVMVASFFALLLGGTVSYCAGVVHVALLDYYHEDVTVTAWLGSLFASMFALTGPVASLVINMFSCRTCVMLGGVLQLVGFACSVFVTDMRWLFLTYAFLVGLGEGLVYTGSIVILGFYFRDQVSLVTGVGMAGVGMGTFFLPPLTQYLLDNYGLKGCFLFLGAIAFHAAEFGALMRPSNLETELAVSAKSGKSVCQRILTSLCGRCDRVGEMFHPAFLLLLLATFSFSVGNFISYLFLPDIFIKQGSSPQEASFLFSMVGIGGALARLLGGFAANDPNIGPSVLFSGTYGVIATIDFFIWPMTKTMVGKVAYAFMFGLYASVGWVLINPLTLHIVGVRNLASGYGIAMFTSGVGTLVGPPIASVIVEAYGKYQEAFYFAGSMFFVSSVCGLMVVVLKKTQSDVPEEKPDVPELQIQTDGKDHAHHVDEVTVVIMCPSTDHHLSPRASSGKLNPSFQEEISN
ncbi:monocarboxylate transporter 12-like isoform X1 [Haliotis rubra]|uniref:monocarboxylate transporter 12-like isoform X1 n=1 Tax=Haliotis rubra TaxID=36100 RepID=UPI001EE5087B|nr:monocarboxylate transporter 12-like isoform X1 [Haliotis rubra]